MKHLKLPAGALQIMKGPYGSLGLYRRADGSLAFVALDRPEGKPARSVVYLPFDRDAFKSLHAALGKVPARIIDPLEDFVKAATKRRANKTKYPAAFITTTEAAAVLRVSVATLNAWRKARKGPAWHRLGKKSIRYKLGELRAWETDQKNKEA